MSILDLVRELESRRNMTLGIDNLKAVFESLGNPQFDLKTVHIAGTNGKGSTTNYTRSILQTAGYKVGTFTSPHLIKHNDRIRINDIPISDEDLHKYIEKTYPLWDVYQLSMFEIDMLISVLYFLDEKVDWVVYEVGLGGRLDATNVINPVVCGITNIDFDHMSILGNTIAKIAFEKGGIIKDEGALITTELKEEALKVLKDLCVKHRASFSNPKLPDIHMIDGGFSFEVDGIELVLHNQGIYQRDNATLAVKLVKALDLDIGDDLIKLGIEKAQWAGRFEAVREGVFLDGAHNRQGVKRLLESLPMLPKPWIVVFSALGDKDHHDMIEAINDKVDTLILTEFEFYRAASVETLSDGFGVETYKDFKEAIDVGLKLKEKGTLLVTGSLYFISQAREYLLEGLD